MGMGDEIMAAGQAQRLYDSDPEHRRVLICDQAWRPRWHDLWEGNPVIARSVKAGERVQKVQNGPGCRPYAKSLSVERGLVPNDAFRADEHVGRLYLTEAEMALGRSVRAQAGSYVVIEPGHKKCSNPNKAWVWDRYQAVVKACPEVTFVQMPYEGSPELSGARTVSAVGFRSVCGVLASATAYVGPEGGLHHAAAALGIPAVVIFGGFISPSLTGYRSHVNLADTGPGSPCGQWKPCPHCREAMARITVEQVASALRGVLGSRAEAVA